MSSTSTHMTGGKANNSVRTTLRLRAIRFATLVLLPTLFTACGDGNGLVMVDTHATPSAVASVLEGQNQQAEVGTFLPGPMTVQVKDVAGMPMRGLAVTWTFSSGGGAEAGAVNPGQVRQAIASTTDHQGRTSVTWRLGTAAGSQKADLSVAVAGKGNGTGQTLTVSFSASAKAGPMASLVVNPKSVSVVAQSNKALGFTAADQYGNAVPSPSVSWSSADGAIASVNGQGVVTGVTQGLTTVTASAGGLTDTASVEVKPVGSPTLAIHAGNGQQGTTGGQLLQELAARLTDGNGGPALGATVQWSIVAGGGQLGAATSTTDAEGVARVTWTLGAQIGQQAASASADGAASVTFTATAEDAPAPDAPGKVTDLVVVGVTETSVTLRWTQVPDGRGAPAKYAIRFASPSLDWTNASASQVSVTGTAVGQSIDYTFTNLDSGTSYEFGMMAYRGTLGSDAVVGSLSNLASVATNSPSLGQNLPAGDPGTVKGLHVVGISSSSVTLRWTQVDDGTGKPAKYAIRTASPTLSWGSATDSEVTVAGNGIGATIDYTWNGLAPSTTYQFALAAYRGTLNQGAVFGSLSNMATATTSASAGPEVASVTATPSSVILYGSGQTAQLTATARDAYGSVIPGIIFQWQSLDPSIASVSTSGMVTSQALGNALIVVTAACCSPADTVRVSAEDQPPTQETLLFSDGYESGGRDHSENGFRWSPPGQVNASVDVSGDRAHTGTYSMRFRFNAVAFGVDGFGEQRFSYPRTREAWVEYYLYWPRNYKHREQGSSGQNKFFALWGERYAGADRPVVVLELWRSSDQASVFRLVRNLSNLSATTQWGDLKPGVGNGGPLVPGQWNRVRIYQYVGSNGADDGVFMLEINGTVVFDFHNIPTTAASSSGYAWDGGYLMGYTNSGFDERTEFFIDNFRFYTASPGWGGR